MKVTKEMVVLSLTETLRILNMYANKSDTGYSFYLDYNLKEIVIQNLVYSDLDNEMVETGLEYKTKSLSDALAYCEQQLLIMKGQA